MQTIQEPVVFPKLAIQDAFIKVVKRQYKVDWQPHVVRQHRILPSSTLDFIDYAIPCFDLAKTLNSDFNIVAHKLVTALRTEPDFAGFKSEALAGYINFQLPNDLIERSILETKKWFLSPYLLVQHQYLSDQFLAWEQVVDENSDFLLMDQAYQYIDHMYNVLGCQHAVEYLISDSSEQALTYITENISQQASHDSKHKSKYSDYISLHKQVRAFLINPQLPYANQELLQIIKNLQIDWKNLHEKLLQGLKVQNYSLVFESEISQFVHDYLDNQKKYTKNPSLFTDSQTQAMYYSKDKTTFAMRSSEGHLYRLSYLLYMLDELYTRKQQQKNRIIVLAPSRSQLAIKSYLKDSRTKRDQEIFYFDPKVSQADILQIHQTIGPLEDYFHRLAHVLETLPENFRNEARQRQAILALIDLPINLCETITQLQLPAFFDALDQSIQMANALKS